MGLGETIGQGTISSANNNGDGPYQPASVGMHGTQIGLMGDPTLRMNVVRPVEDLRASRTLAGATTLTWLAANDTVDGYYVYRAASTNGPFTRITPTLIPPTGSVGQYADSTLGGGRAVYMVRAVKLENTTSGSYFNASTGQMVEWLPIGITDDLTVTSTTLSPVIASPRAVDRSSSSVSSSLYPSKKTPRLSEIVDELGAV
jgi:hypothetical protein